MAKKLREEGDGVTIAEVAMALLMEYSKKCLERGCSTKELANGITKAFEESLLESHASFFKEKFEVSYYYF